MFKLILGKNVDKHYCSYILTLTLSASGDIGRQHIVNPRIRAAMKVDAIIHNNRPSTASRSHGPN